MTISIDDLGIWGNLGTITPQLNSFVNFPVFSYSSSEIFRLTASFNCPDWVKIWVKQTINGIDLNRWIAFYPRPNQSLIINIPLPETLKKNGIPRIISAKKSFKYLSNDTFINFSLTLEDFTSFSISQPELSDQEKAYLDQLLRQYIKENAASQNQTQYPPIL